MREENLELYVSTTDCDDQALSPVRYYCNSAQCDTVVTTQHLVPPSLPTTFTSTADCDDKTVVTACCVISAILLLTNHRVILPSFPTICLTKNAYQHVSCEVNLPKPVLSHPGRK